MKQQDKTAGGQPPIDQPRRDLLSAAGASALAAAVGGLATGAPGTSRAQNARRIRWGIVGTGSIANRMATMMQMADAAEPTAVSSRRMETAKEFADNHRIPMAFDSWEYLAEFDGVDAIYVATPTSVREEICVAAANNGKHVLGEKPFASLASLRRITAACRENGVGFMDGTHFVHHPRTAAIRRNMEEQVGWPWSLDSGFQFFLPDRGNIRFNRELEPMGAIGDAGWYNMRAAVEYLAANIDIQSSSAYLRRDSQTDAVISASGVMKFSDGSTTTWNCGFDSGAVVMDLRLSGENGVISIDNFLSNDRDGSASYAHRVGGFGPGATTETVRIASSKPGAVLMFEDFAAIVRDPDMIERSINASERTQRWLDTAWESAIEAESRA